MAYGDPFDAAGADLPPQQAGGVSPDFWRNLAMFGSQMSVAANARTPQGFLAYGNGFAGPFGAGIQGGMQNSMDVAKLRSNLGLQNAQTQGAALGNYEKMLNLPVLQQRARMQQQFYQDPQGFMRSMGMGPQDAPAVLGPQSSADPAPQDTNSAGVSGPPNQNYASLYGDPTKPDWQKSNLTTISAPGGAPFTVNKAAAPAFQGFLADLENQGYKVNPGESGGYNLRNVTGGSTLSPHAYGVAIDINPAANPYSKDANGGSLTTNLPPNVGDLAAKWGLEWGGNWKSLKDPMHFEYVGQKPTQYAQAGNVATDASTAPAPQQTQQPSQPQQQQSQPQAQQNIGSSQALATAQHYEQQANQIEMMHSLGLPMPGDPAALRQAAQQYRSLGLAGPTAGAQEAAKLPFVGPTEAAKAANAITTDRFGNMYQGTRYLGRGSEVKPIWNPQKQQYEYGDVGGIGIGAQAPAIGSGQTGSSDIPEKPGPMQEDFMKIRGENLAHQFDKIDTDAAAAKESNYLFDNLRNDSQSWDMGKFADFEGDARAWLSAAAQAAGIATPGLDQKLADFQAFNKSSGMLLRSAVHETSSRAAVQEYNLIGQTLPQPTTSKQGFGQIADQWQGLSDFRLAKQKFAQGYNGKPQDFNVDFNSKVSPSAFLLNRMSQTEQGQQDMQTMMARMQQTPPGKLLAKRLLQQYQFAKGAHLFDDLPATGAPQGAQ